MLKHLPTFTIGLAAAFCATALHAQETTLRVANWLPPSHPLVAEVIVPLTEQIAEATDGEVVAEILPAPLGPPAAHFDFAQNGIADITFGVQGYLPGRFTTTGLAELPFLGDSAEAISVAYWRVWKEMLQEAGEYDGVKVLAVFTHGPGHVYTTGDDLSRPDALTGQKLRVGGGIVHEVATRLGAVPVEGPSSKAYELLSQGVADGILFPHESVAFFGLIPLLESGVIVPGGLYNTSFFIVMNQGTWDRLTPEQQDEIGAVIGEPLARMAGQMWDRADAAALEIMQSELDLNEATEAQMAAWRDDLQPLIDKELGAIDERGIDAAAAYDMFKREIAAESE